MASVSGGHTVAIGSRKVFQCRYAPGMVLVIGLTSATSGPASTRINDGSGAASAVW